MSRRGLPKAHQHLARRQPQPHQHLARRSAPWTRLLGAVLAVAAASATLTAPARAADRAVIVVLDGLRSSEGFDDPDHRFIPRMALDLAPQGALARVCANLGSTHTVAGHSTIGSGRYQTLAEDGTERPQYPLLWEYFRHQTGLSANATVLVTMKSKIKPLSYSTYPGYGAPDSARVIGPTWSDFLVLDQFLTDMAAHHPIVSFLNLGGIDTFAHTGDWARYTWAIGIADSLVSVLWDRIEADPFYAGRTALIVTGDHGRHADGYGDWKDHGDGCPGCRRIPLLCLGPDFQPGIESWTPCEQIDICKTLGSLLGVATPVASGRILQELLAVPAAAGEPAGEGQTALSITTDGLCVRFRPIGVDLRSLRIFDVSGRQMDSAGRLSGGAAWSWTAPVRGVYYYKAEGRAEHEGDDQGGRQPGGHGADRQPSGPPVAPSWTGSVPLR
ncbi:MAG: hypothetical protein ACE15D_14705 [Candidatus Eisenbacteria bacterium]